MDIEKLEKMARLVLEDLKRYSGSLSYFPEARAEIKNLMIIASKILTDHQAFFEGVCGQIKSYGTSEARHAVYHLLAILDIEKTSEAKVKEMKIFESADEKLKQSSLSFRKDDYTSAFHNLNTALELVLKDKLGIPMTITKINTSRIIDILVKYKIEPHLYLAESKKRVVTIDNKVKHQGYSPSKIDCINGIKAMEELISRLRNTEIRLAEEVRNKIYEGL